MRNNISVFLLAAAFMWMSCNKDTTNNTEDRVGISRVTHFATFEMQGNEFMSLVKGTAFTEPGIKAFEAGAAQLLRRAAYY